MQTQAIPAAVVVDTRDGYTFWQGSDRALFGEEAARAFVGHRNAGLKPEYRLYRVYALVPDGAGPWRAGGELEVLFAAASDEEYAALESAAVRAGLLLKCPEAGCGLGVGQQGDLCTACGAGIQPA